MKSCYFLLFSLVLAVSCADDIDSSGSTATLPEDANNPKQFFPVLDYLRGEVKMVDSFATAIRQYVTVNGKTDSGFISPAQFREVMEEYLSADLSKENFEKYYSESSFFDQGTQTSTFTYSTKNDELEFHRIDVLVQGTESYDKVSSIYLEKFAANDDSSVVKKILLRNGISVMINSEVTKGNAPPVVKQEKFVWNDFE